MSVITAHAARLSRQDRLHVLPKEYVDETHAVILALGEYLPDPSDTHGPSLVSTQAPGARTDANEAAALFFRAGAYQGRRVQYT